MKVKVNFKKPTVMLTADKYSSMLEEMESLRQGLAQYKSWCENMNVSLSDAREQVDALHGAVARKDAEVVERSALIQELNDQIEASETARKDAEDALVIAKKNATLREMGWDMLHKQIEELQRENRGLQMKLERAEKRAEDTACELEGAKQTIANLREFREELGQEVDEANRTITEMATELTELKADRNIALAEIERLRARITEKDKTNDVAVRATSELADMVVTAREERDTARTEVEDLRLELMERDCRVDELEKQVEWLRDKNDEWAQIANDQKATIVNYEAVIQSMQEEMKADHAEVDTLRRQLKANEESYMALRTMYEAMRDAATDLVSHVRANTFAN